MAGDARLKLTIIALELLRPDLGSRRWSDEADAWQASEAAQAR